MYKRKKYRNESIEGKEERHTLFLKKEDIKKVFEGLPCNLEEKYCNAIKTL